MIAEFVDWLGAALTSVISRGKVTGAQRGARNLLQLQLLTGEAVANVEFLAPYGMSALPANGADVILLTVGGTRDHKVVIAVDDPGKRIADLAAGEFGFSDGSDRIVFRGAFTEIAGPKAKWLRSDNTVHVVAPDIVLGSLGASLERLVDERFIALFNAHTHIAPNGLTSVPTTTMAAGTHTTTTVKAS